jgi:hypothetical protein
MAHKSPKSSDYVDAAHGDGDYAYVHGSTQTTPGTGSNPRQNLWGHEASEAEIALEKYVAEDGEPTRAGGFNDVRTNAVAKRREKRATPPAQAESQPQKAVNIIKRHQAEGKDTMSEHYDATYAYQRTDAPPKR